MFNHDNSYNNLVYQSVCDKLKDNSCLRRASVPAPCRVHVTDGYRQRSAGPAAGPKHKKLCLCPQCRDSTRFDIIGMRLVPKMKILHSTILHRRMFRVPQVETEIQGLGPAGTTWETWGCSSICKNVHRVMKSPTMNKLITFFSPHLGKLNLLFLFWCHLLRDKRWRTSTIQIQYWCSHGEVRINGERT